MPNVSLKNNNEVKLFEVHENELIWDELDRLGTKLPAGCLAGSCGTCRIEVLEGAQNLSPLSVVEKETVHHLEEQYKKIYGEDFLKGKTLRLSCRARVTGDISITPFKEKI
ncbi:MAG: hypothetical protein DRQ88_04605 [Epsilonproteobacteria bacterium]|nr:MAG: hypothetical protein DRQ88_04605 [Campylobacterota bacterium]